MLASRVWTAYESAYRVREVEILTSWIVARKGGCVVGLTESGKSNLLGFMCQRPEVVQSYWPDNCLKLDLVLVDLNNLPGSDLSTFYRIMLRALYESRDHFANRDSSLANAVETLYRKIDYKPDSFLSQSALREALLLFKAKVVDPFDQFCQTAEPHLLDNLQWISCLG